MTPAFLRGMLLCLLLTLCLLSTLNDNVHVHAGFILVTPKETITLLESFYNSTNGPAWDYEAMSKNWPDGQASLLNGRPWNFTKSTLTDDYLVNPCAAESSNGTDHFAGIVCTCYAYDTDVPNPTFTCNVTELALPSANLIGQLPNALFRLTTLTVLTLYNNALVGKISSDLQFLNQLNYLELGKNSFTGVIPTEIGQLTQLTFLDLYENSFVGHIPSTIGNLRNLSQLYVTSNYLTGEIPQELTQLSVLQYFYCDHNSLRGALPNSIGNLRELLQLYVNDNKLTNSIPDSIGQLSRMMTLQMGTNQFTGIVPSSITNMKNLRILILRQNNFISSSIDNPFAFVSPLQTNLSIIDVSTNNFTGTLPSFIFYLPKLTDFIAASNCFQGTLPVDICQARNMKNLIMNGLTSGKNCRKYFWKGTIFQKLFNGATAKNFMDNDIPPCIYTMPNIENIILQGNNLQGYFPQSIGSNVQEISASRNRISGSVVNLFATKLNNSLLKIDYAYNRVTGYIDVFNSAMNRNNKTSLYLQVNRLGGYIPNNLLDMKNINILQGNVYACGVGQARNLELPLHDPDYNSFQCSSGLGIGGDGILLANFIIILCFVFIVLYIRISGGFIGYNAKAIAGGICGCNEDRYSAEQHTITDADADKDIDIDKGTGTGIASKSQSELSSCSQVYITMMKWLNIADANANILTVIAKEIPYISQNPTQYLPGINNFHSIKLYSTYLNDMRRFSMKVACLFVVFTCIYVCLSGKSYRIVPNTYTWVTTAIYMTGPVTILCVMIISLTSLMWVSYLITTMTKTNYFTFTKKGLIKTMTGRNIQMHISIPETISVCRNQSSMDNGQTRSINNNNNNSELTRGGNEKRGTCREGEEDNVGNITHSATSSFTHISDITLHTYNADISTRLSDSGSVSGSGSGSGNENFSYNCSKTAIHTIDMTRNENESNAATTTSIRVSNEVAGAAINNEIESDITEELSIGTRDTEMITRKRIPSIQPDPEYANKIGYTTILFIPLIRILFLVILLWGVIIAGNIAYLWVQANGSPTQQTSAKLLFSMIKLFWMLQVTPTLFQSPYLYMGIERKYHERFIRKVFGGHVAIMFFIKAIPVFIIPVLTAACFDATCFKDYFVARNDIPYNYSYTSCGGYVVGTNHCATTYQVNVNDHAFVPFVYNYTCSAAIMRTYIPLYQQMVVILLLKNLSHFLYLAWEIWFDTKSGSKSASASASTSTFGASSLWCFPTWSSIKTLVLNIFILSFPTKYLMYSNSKREKEYDIEHLFPTSMSVWITKSISGQLVLLLLVVSVGVFAPIFGFTLLLNIIIEMYVSQLILGRFLYNEISCIEEYYAGCNNSGNGNGNINRNGRTPKEIEKEKQFGDSTIGIQTNAKTASTDMDSVNAITLHNNAVNDSVTQPWGALAALTCLESQCSHVPMTSLKLCQSFYVFIPTLVFAFLLWDTTYGAVGIQGISQSEHYNSLHYILIVIPYTLEVCRRIIVDTRLGKVCYNKLLNYCFLLSTCRSNSIVTSSSSSSSSSNGNGNAENKDRHSRHSVHFRQHATENRESDDSGISMELRQSGPLSTPNSSSSTRISSESRSKSEAPESSLANVTNPMTADHII